jgi:hypothetical protein
MFVCVVGFLFFRSSLRGFSFYVSFLKDSFLKAPFARVLFRFMSAKRSA